VVSSGVEATWKPPVVSQGAEYLVMGYLMRRNILTYKAPPNNEGYDLICIHPNPRHRSRTGKKTQIRVQVKSRYATDCDRGFPVKKTTLDAFDFLIIVFLNIGKFYGRNDGLKGAESVVFYTLPRYFVRKHHDRKSSWEKVRLRGLNKEIQKYRDDKGFELIAKALGIEKPRKKRKV